MPINITVASNGGQAVSAVNLAYRVGFAPETVLAARKTTQAPGEDQALGQMLARSCC